MKKFTLLKEDFILSPSGFQILYRIVSLKNFSFTAQIGGSLRTVEVRKGDLGGYVGSEENLSHEGNCWIFQSGQVWGNAKISENALIYGSAQVWRNSEIRGNSMIFDEAKVVSGKTWGNVRICSKVRLDGSDDYLNKSLSAEDFSEWIHTLSFNS